MPRRTQSLEIHTDETETNTPQNTVETISSGEVCTVWECYRQTADIFHMISGLREQKNFHFCTTELLLLQESL